MGNQIKKPVSILEVSAQSEEGNLPPLPFNLYNITVLRKHYHKLGNKAMRELATCNSEKLKVKLRLERDHYLSIANYLDIADHIKMSEL